MKIDKIDAFSLVVEILERGDEKTANEIMKIITNSINDEKKNNKFSLQIEVKGKKEEKYFKKLLQSNFDK